MCHWTKEELNMSIQCSNALWTALLGALVLMAAGCSTPTANRVFNPFYEPPSETALLGEMTDDAIAGDADKDENARAALEHMASYQRAHDPKPANPVMLPSVVRLMWVPDHLNRYGDLIPAHYYYLRVLPERWKLSDAFELESQLNSTTTPGTHISHVVK